jgi:hypothetical protein
MLLVGLLLSLPAPAEVIDRVEASVEEQLVTTSDVGLEAQLGLIDASPSPFWDPDHLPPLDRLVDAALVRELAGDVQIYQPSDADVAARLAALRDRLPDPQAWTDFTRRWGLDEEQLGAILRRRMVVERYLARGIQVRPDDRPAWWKECDELVARQRASLRIRIIPPWTE